MGMGAAPAGSGGERIRAAHEEGFPNEPARYNHSTPSILSSTSAYSVRRRSKFSSEVSQ